MILSIIIPVYNVERYVRRCLESVFSSGAAGNDEVEVIVVNDGTPDGSMTIVHEFEAKYDNLIIINQENAGLSAARNAALTIARGKYVWFIDSDDYVSSTAVTELVSICKGQTTDVLYFDTYAVYEDDSCKMHVVSPLPNKRHRYLYGRVGDGYFYYRKLHTGLVQRCAFRRAFLSEEGLKFKPGIYHEDLELMHRVHTKAHSMLPIRKAFYYYVYRSSGSIMSTFKIKRFHDILSMIRSFREKAAASSDWRDKTIYNDGVFGQCYSLLFPKYASHPEFVEFLAEHRRELRSSAIHAYFGCLRKNSLGKTYKLLKVLLLK